MKRWLIVLLSTSLAGLVGFPAQAQEAPSAVVQVRAQSFQPQSIDIPLNGTVEWVIQENGHSISASDYRFDFDPDRTLRIGDTRRWTFTEDETVRYFCRVHAPSMSGIIKVGAGSPPPPPPPPISGESRNVPSLAYPTIDSALVGIPRDSEIVLAPGTYAPFKVEVDDVLIRSAGNPEDVIVDGDVVVDGQNFAKTGVVIKADNVRLRGLTVRNVADYSVLVEGNDTRLEFLFLEAGFFAGIKAESVLRLVIEDSEVTGSPSAHGIDVSNSYDLLLQRSIVVGARSGVRLRAVTGPVVRDSIFSGNGTGIALLGVIGESSLGAHVINNEVVSSNAPSVSFGGPSDLVVGAGIWVDGTSSVAIVGNQISGSKTYGIAASAFNGPNLGLSIRGNPTSDSRVADVGWDGFGTACVETEGSMDGFALECENGPVPGVPNPKVDAELISYALLGEIV